MDAYDRAIRWLRGQPNFAEALRNNWSGADQPSDSHPARILFGYATRSRGQENEANEQCGCLTQIRNWGYYKHAETEELELAIKADERIPKTYTDITLDNLPVFAEWQRRLDKELDRTPPVWLGPEIEEAPVTT